MKKYLTLSCLLWHTMMGNCPALHQANEMNSNQDNAQTGSSSVSDVSDDNEESILAKCRGLIKESLDKKGKEHPGATLDIYGVLEEIISKLNDLGLSPETVRGCLYHPRMVEHVIDTYSALIPPESLYLFAIGCGAQDLAKALAKDHPHLTDKDELSKIDTPWYLTSAVVRYALKYDNQPLMEFMLRLGCHRSPYHGICFSKGCDGSLYGAVVFLPVDDFYYQCVYAKYKVLYDDDSVPMCLRFVMGHNLNGLRIAYGLTNGASWPLSSKKQGVFDREQLGLLIASLMFFRSDRDQATIDETVKYILDQVPGSKPNTLFFMLFEPAIRYLLGTGVDVHDVALQKLWETARRFDPSIQLRKRSEALACLINVLKSYTPKSSGLDDQWFKTLEQAIAHHTKGEYGHVALFRSLLNATVLGRNDISRTEALLRLAQKQAKPNRTIISELEDQLASMRK